MKIGKYLSGPDLALLVCLASTLYMTGVIVVVHVVHYPLFERVEAAAFRRYHAEHVRLMSWVVFVPMVVELLTSVWLVVSPPVGSNRWLAGFGLAAAVLTWAVTVGLSVPQHNRLSEGFDRVPHRTLIRTNMIRLAAWVVHSATLLVMTARALN